MCEKVYILNGPFSEAYCTGLLYHVSLPIVSHTVEKEIILILRIGSLHLDTSDKASVSKFIWTVILSRKLISVQF